MVPKAELPADIDRLGEQMDTLGYDPDIELWLMAETPGGVFNARELCQAHPRVGALLLGTSDLGKCLRVPATIGRDGLLYALTLRSHEKEHRCLGWRVLDLANPEVYQVQCDTTRTGL